MAEREPVADRETLERWANHLDLISRWADDLAHEIKNPLHAMVINLELVKRRAGGEPGPVVERAEVVESELHRVHALVDSLLRLVRPWPDVATTDLRQLIQGFRPMLTARARVRQVEYEHEGGEGIVAMSPADVSLVLVNLVDRALSAMPGGGRLTTRFDAADDGIRVVITDSGEPQERDPEALALAVSRRLITSVGGALELRPAPDGTGTEAVVTLPRTGST